MSNPTIPPEAVEAGMRAFCFDERLDDHTETVEDVLLAAYPHLRRAILAEVVPQIVEMAREDMPAIDDRGGRSPHYQMLRHTPASILAALEKGEA